MKPTLEEWLGWAEQNGCGYFYVTVPAMLFAKGFVIDKSHDGKFFAESFLAANRHLSADHLIEALAVDLIKFVRSGSRINGKWQVSKPDISLLGAAIRCRLGSDCFWINGDIDARTNKINVTVLPVPGNICEGRQALLEIPQIKQIRAIV